MHESCFLFKTKAEANCIMSLGRPSICPAIRVIELLEARSQSSKVKVAVCSSLVASQQWLFTIGANIDSMIDLNLVVRGRSNLLPYKESLKAFVIIDRNPW